jgi:hypothetical protein
MIRLDDAKRRVSEWAPSLRDNLLLLTALLVLLPSAADSQWAANPGEKVRDAFGPSTGGEARVCRGACGVGCPSECTERTTYECAQDQRLRRVRAFTCGTHQGCRDHDNCLDRCSQQYGSGFDCDAQCHSEAVSAYGLEMAVSWAAAGGPFDGAPITFEYTREGPDDPTPTFRCPEGASLECSDGTGRCLANGNVEAPVFDSYPATGEGAMRISNFRSGPLCGNAVCEQTVDVRVTGDDSCDRNDGPASCTRYGIEFDYDNADPSMPLECSTSTSGTGGDFIGGLIKKGFDSAPELNSETFKGNEGLGQLLGVLQKVVASAESPEDVQISMAPLGPDGKPIESQRVGSGPQSSLPPVPRTVDLPETSGHLLVPMYQLADGSGRGAVTVREVRCSHAGVPVLEATFRLHE